MTFRQSFVLATLLVLTVMGLNASNQGINNLTGENRNPIVAVSGDRSTVNLYWLGADYPLELDRLPLSVQSLLRQGEPLVRSVEAYLARVKGTDYLTK